MWGCAALAAALALLWPYSRVRLNHVSRPAPLQLCPISPQYHTTRTHPPCPPLATPQVCKLVQSQQQLSKQLEELTLEIGQAQHAARLREQAQHAASAQRPEGARERAAWAAGGALLGAAAAVLLLRGGRG